LYKINDVRGKQQDNEYFYPYTTIHNLKISLIRSANNNLALTSFVSCPEALINNEEIRGNNGIEESMKFFSSPEI
jgi:hypothetical protein